PDAIVASQPSHPAFVARLTRTATHQPITVTLLGIGEHPSSGKTWWNAEGTVLPQAPYAQMKPDPTGRQIEPLQPGELPREFLLTIEGMGTTTLECPDARRWYGGSAPLD